MLQMLLTRARVRTGTDLNLHAAGTNLNLYVPLQSKPLKLYVAL